MYECEQCGSTQSDHDCSGWSIERLLLRRDVLAAALSELVDAASPFGADETVAVLLEMTDPSVPRWQRVRLHDAVQASLEVLKRRDG